MLPCTRDPTPRTHAGFLPALAYIFPCTVVTRLHSYRKFRCEYKRLRRAKCCSQLFEPKSHFASRFYPNIQIQSLIHSPNFGFKPYLPSPRESLSSTLTSRSAKLLGSTLNLQHQQSNPLVSTNHESDLRNDIETLIQYQLSKQTITTIKNHHPRTYARQTPAYPPARQLLSISFFRDIENAFKNSAFCNAICRRQEVQQVGKQARNTHGMQLHK